LKERTLLEEVQSLALSVLQENTQQQQPQAFV
jgi:hypothetical protein